MSQYLVGLQLAVKILHLPIKSTPIECAIISHNPVDVKVIDEPLVETLWLMHDSMFLSDKYMTTSVWFGPGFL